MKQESPFISRFIHGLPILKINLLRSLCFDVLIDPSISYNLIDPNFIFFEVDEDFYTCIDGSPDTLLKPKMHLFKDFFEVIVSNEMIGKDGVIQTVDKINFNFEFMDESYSEIYSVVELKNTRYNNKNVSLDVVLGSDFLLKHNWIIDYKKLTLSSGNINQKKRFYIS